MAVYEHNAQAKLVASMVLGMVELATDEVPDQQQIAEYINKLLNIVSVTAGVMTAEQKKKFRLKFAGVVACHMQLAALNEYLPDSES